MFIRDIFKEWDSKTYAHRNFSHLTSLRTFSVEEFKQVFKVSSILVKRHPAGFLFFKVARMEDWGLVYTKGIPDNPVISLVCDFSFNMFFLLHENGETPTSVTINSPRYQKHLNRTKSSPSYQTIREYNDYVIDSYMDAFEGDSDAYWNIE